MARMISQEAFNDAVRANMEQSDLSPEDAVLQTVSNFESRGVDLRPIIKEPPTYFEHIKDVITQLKDLSPSKPGPKEVMERLSIIKTECDIGLPYRVLVAEFGAYPALLESLSYESDDGARKLCLKTLISLMDKQPDLLDDAGISAIMNYLTGEYNSETKRLSLKWARVCCIMNEINRQKFFAVGILEPLKEFLSEDFTDILKEALSLCRALVFDDDVRVEFGKAHQYSRLVANDTMCSLIYLLCRLQNDVVLAHEILTTICVLLVREEYCKKVVDGGGLETIKNVMISFESNEKINKQCFRVLKALAADDYSKIQILNKEFAPVISKTLNLNKKHVQTATAGLYCVAAVSLRSPENSRALFDSGIASVIVSVMKLYPEDKLVQKTASWAVRNMVSRNKDQRAAFLDLGIEKLLGDSLKKFGDISYDIRAALRDLGCKV